MATQKPNEIRLEFTPEGINVKASILINRKKLWIFITILVSILIIVASSISFENRQLLLEALLGSLQLIFVEENAISGHTKLVS